MNLRVSGRKPESSTAIHELVTSLEKYGEVEELQENILSIDGREKALIAFNSQSYFERKGYYWFSLAKTKYAQLTNWNEDHAWLILICGTHGHYFIPFRQVKPLLQKFPSNRRDGRWDLYIRMEGATAYFGVAEIKKHLNVTEQFHHFEQIWERPAIEEIYTDEAIYIPDNLPEPDRKTGRILRVVRDTNQSRKVKELYHYKCQICGWTAFSPRLKNKWYCEAHHVQPLGKRYRGPDHISNILALCPTHHCMMDLGVLAIQPSNLTILSTDKQELDKTQLLSLHREHGLNQKYLKFHLDNIYLGERGITEIRLSNGTQGL